jgi:hypothetical protein
VLGFGYANAGLAASPPDLYGRRGGTRWTGAWDEEA